MQSIERYGVIALVFLVVTVAAVIMWDERDPAPEAVAASAGGPPAASEDDDRTAPPERVELRTDPLRNRALERASFATGRPEDAVPPEDPLEGAAPAGSGTDLPVPVPDSAPPAASAPEAPPAAAAPAAPRVHVVKGGETLSEIAMAELGTWRRWPEIVAKNPGLDPLRLRAGARLVLPPREATPASTSASFASPSAAAPPAPASPPAAAAAPAEGATWTVREGDRLWTIAARTLGDGARWPEIAALNPGLDVGRLYRGQVLRLPAGAREAAAATPKPKVSVARADAAASAKRGRVR
ncbi:MAG: LysM domain-containing protein [Planctomycetota bacterium]